MRRQSAAGTVSAAGSGANGDKPRTLSFPDPVSLTLDCHAGAPANSLENAR